MADENSKQFSTWCVIIAVVFAIITSYWQLLPQLARMGVDLSGLAPFNKTSFPGGRSFRTTIPSGSSSSCSFSLPA